MNILWMEDIMNWLLVFFLIIPTNAFSDELSIIDEGETIAVVKRESFILSLPGLDILDTYELEKLMEQINQQIEKKPVNAKMDDYGRIIKEENGHRLNVYAFRKLFFEYFYEQKMNEIHVPKMTVFPKVDSELLASIREKRIGHYVTYFNSHNKARANNIALAAEAINNYVVFPGETFSFNEVVGQRTVEKGYMKAPEIVRGEMTEGVGGGICQVSSTLFNAVDKSGVKIVERYSHSRYVPYVPPGRDATVSWYGPDFRFQNNYHEPLLIRAKASNGQMMVEIYSSENIVYKPREVPDASYHIPEEIQVENHENN